MTALSEMQFELLPRADAEDGQVFGIGSEVSIDDGGFLPGDDDWEVQDTRNPRRGGKSFGRDVLNGPTWGFNLHVNRSNVAEAVATLGKFKTAWRALGIRSTPGAVLPLRYCLDGRYRRVYGRPRRFSAPPSNLILSGYVPVTVDFECVDSFIYDDEESVVTLGLQAGLGNGGFVFPVTFPTTTLPSGSGGAQAVVGGDAPAYPVIRITGPVTRPSIETERWNLTLDITIGASEYVDIDTRPWAMSVLLNGTSSVAGKLGRRQYLEDIYFEPGGNTVVFRGSASSNAATCAVRWSNTWNSI